MQKHIGILLLIALLCMQGYSLFKLHALEDKIGSTYNNIRTLQNRVDDLTRNISFQIAEALEDQPRLLHSTSTEILGVDPDTLVVSVAYSVTPKTVTETTAVFLDFQGDLVPMERQGTQFSATRQVALMDTVVEPTVVIEDNGVKQMAEDEGLMLGNLREVVFPPLSAGFMGNSSYSSSSYRVDGSLEVDTYPSYYLENRITKVTYLYQLEDTIVKEISVPVDGEGSVSLPVKETFSLEKGQVLTSYLVALDQLGFTHKYMISHHVAGSNVQREPYFEEMEILSPKGEVVYRLDENNFERVI